MIATIWNICLPAITRSSHSLIICLFKNIAAWMWAKCASNFMLSLVTYCTMLCSCRAFKGDIQVLSNSEIINSITCTETTAGMASWWASFFGDKSEAPLLWQRWDHKVREMLTSSLLSLYNAFLSQVLVLPLFSSSPEVAAFPPTQGRGHCRDTAAYTC